MQSSLSFVAMFSSGLMPRQFIALNGLGWIVTQRHTGRRRISIIYNNDDNESHKNILQTITQ
jgi:hypothetical protein